LLLHRSKVAVVVYKVPHGSAPSYLRIDFAILDTLIVFTYLLTYLSWPVHLRCRPSKTPRTSLFLQRLPRPVSGSLLHCWQPSIYVCWPSDVELPATGGYVGAIFDNLPHSTRNVSVHWVISWHLAYL